jgi:hypothetical protein
VAGTSSTGAEAAVVGARAGAAPSASFFTAMAATAHCRTSSASLSTRSEAFRSWWAAHNVRYHQTGTKRLRHAVVGDLELGYEVMELAADAGLRLAVFTAESGSRSEEALNLLASWAATEESEPTQVTK